MRILVEQALLDEDHLSFKDKPEHSQELSLTVDDCELKGWIAKTESGYQVVIFKSHDGIDMYIEEIFEDEAEIKETVSAICKKLFETKPESSEDEECTECPDEDREKAPGA